MRADVQRLLGGDLARLRPGSPEALALKDVLVREGMWSQYLEVGIGPDAELFTKAQPMSSVGHLAEVGIGGGSTWNNPEPEVVLVVSSNGAIVGATLGNDVNLRDVEGRSALLLGRAKDNNASASLGPFMRLFDGRFGLDDIRSAEVRLVIEGADGYRLEGASEMGRISRDPADLVGLDHRARSRLPRRRGAVPGHDVRAGRRPGRAGHGLHAPSRRRRDRLLATARDAREHGGAERPGGTLDVRGRGAHAQPRHARRCCSHEASYPPTVALSIRRATPRDAAVLHEVAAATFPLASPPDTRREDNDAFIAANLSEARFREYLADAGADAVPRVRSTAVSWATRCSSTGEPYDADAARAVVTRPTVELSKIYVRPEHHQSGIAAELMAISVRAAADTGAGAYGWG